MAVIALVMGGCAVWPATDPSRPALVYSPPNWPQEVRADLYQPEGPGPFPALVMVHGGGWNGRDRSDMTRLSQDLQERDYVVLNIDYRLAPDYRYPAAVDDVRQATRWLVSHAAELRVDPTRLGGWGYSAGAQLLALAACTPGSPRFSTVVVGGMPSDLPRYPHSPLITTFLGATAADNPALWHEASPIAHAASCPPMFLYHGTSDHLVGFDQAIAMRKALLAEGVETELHPVHGFGHIPTFVLGWGARRDARNFLDAHLKLNAPAAP